jgi:hypothetical protein
MLIRVFYISEIADSLTDVDVQVILGAAQINNRWLDVTGMLAQSDGHFAQLLEGRLEVVLDMVKKIRKDPRHRALRILLEETIVTRQFTRCAMRLVRRDDMTDVMRALHRDGCASKAETRRLVQC